MKKIYNIIKNLSNEDLKEFKKENDIKLDFNDVIIGPDIIPVKYHNENIFIYKNFEIFFEKKIIESLANNDIKTINNYYFECHLIEEKIIINYPDNLNNNNKYILVIGSLTDENIFINENIFIYNNNEKKRKI